MFLFLESVTYTLFPRKFVLLRTVQAEHICTRQEIINYKAPQTRQIAARHSILTSDNLRKRHV